MPLDMNFVESQFPALRGRQFTYLDNAGGSLVLQGVADRVSEYLLTSSVQHGATYTKSQLAMERLAAAQKSVATLINASRPEEVVMGPSTTALLRILGIAIGETLSPGDEVIVWAGARFPETAHCATDRIDGGRAWTGRMGWNRV